MRKKIRYDKVDKYLVYAKLNSPMHVGSEDGMAQEILLHPVTRLPFIQASSISGVMRNYYQNCFGNSEPLFGGTGIDEGQSMIKVTDGLFVNSNELILELRPRVKIDQKKGTVSSGEIKGSKAESGHKFDMEYVGAGAEFSFSVYHYCNEKDANDYKDKIIQIFAGMQNGEVLLGGQKSNGCGDISIQDLYYKEFDLKTKDGRDDWLMEPSSEISGYKDIKTELKSSETGLYRITVNAKAESSVLIKGYQVNDFGKDAADSINIQNAQKDYIIPGTSLKGALRSRVMYIAEYLGLDQRTVDEIFGSGSAKDIRGTVGNARFLDAVIGTKEDNDKNEMSHRIHIDKFTGGVMNRSLFTEMSASGDINLRIDIVNKYVPERAVGLIIMALRDMANGICNIGGGYHIGHGFLEISKIKVEKDLNAAEIDFDNNEIRDEREILKRCLSSVKEGISKC